MQSLLSPLLCQESTSILANNRLVELAKPSILIYLCTNLCHLSFQTDSVRSCFPVHSFIPWLMPWPQDGTLQLEPSVQVQRRPRVSREKCYHCDYPGCTKSFYDNRNMRQHQNLKHGRIPRYRRSGQGFVHSGEFVYVDGSASVDSDGHDRSEGQQDTPFKEQHGDTALEN